MFYEMAMVVEEQVRMILYFCTSKSLLQWCFPALYILYVMYCAEG